jgi:hypothetical protein
MKNGTIYLVSPFLNSSTFGRHFQCCHIIGKWDNLKKSTRLGIGYAVYLWKGIWCTQRNNTDTLSNGYLDTSADLNTEGLS